MAVEAVVLVSLLDQVEKKEREVVKVVEKVVIMMEKGKMVMEEV